MASFVFPIPVNQSHKRVFSAWCKFIQKKSSQENLGTIKKHKMKLFYYFYYFCITTLLSLFTAFFFVSLQNDKGVAFLLKPLVKTNAKF